MFLKWSLIVLVQPPDQSMLLIDPLKRGWSFAFVRRWYWQLVTVLAGRRLKQLVMFQSSAIDT